MKTAKAVVAVCIVALLATFGISRLGGETWISSAAHTEAGWHAYTGPFTPQPPSFLRPFVIPGIMVLAIIAVSLLGALLNRQSRRDAPVSMSSRPPQSGSAE